MSYRRRSIPFLAWLLAGFAGLAVLFIHAHREQAAATRRLRDQLEFVTRLGITDLCLVTDARYTRHPAMADLHSAFQDYPTSLEHFPSGALLAPPPHLRVHGNPQ